MKTKIKNNMGIIVDKLDSVTIKNDVDYEISYEMFLESEKEIKTLKSENEQLKQRLANAIELPCKIGDTIYYIYADWNNNDKLTIGKSVVFGIKFENGKFYICDSDLCYDPIGDNYCILSKEQAEQRLKELEK